MRTYCKHFRDLATGRGGQPANVSTPIERGRLAKVQAALTETKVRTLLGELVEAGAVEAEPWPNCPQRLQAFMRILARLSSKSGD